MSPAEEPMETAKISPDLKENSTRHRSEHTPTSSAVAMLKAGEHRGMQAGPGLQAATQLHRDLASVRRKLRCGCCCDRDTTRARQSQFAEEHDPQRIRASRARVEALRHQRRCRECAFRGQGTACEAALSWAAVGQGSHVIEPGLRRAARPTHAHPGDCSAKLRVWQFVHT